MDATQAASLLQDADNAPGGLSGGLPGGPNLPDRDFRPGASRPPPVTTKRIHAPPKKKITSRENFSDQRIVTRSPGDRATAMIALETMVIGSEDAQRPEAGERRRRYWSVM